MDILILNKEGADLVRGRYGVYSAIDPVALPDGKFMVPKRCLTDPDLVEALDALTTNTEEENQILDLPAVGEECVAGVIYKYVDETGTIDNNQSGNVKCVQTHNRTIYPPYETPALFTFFRENADDLDWIPNEYVYVGWKRVYGGNTYTVIQEHMTLEAWTPDAVPALWSLDVAPSSDWTAGTAYAVDDQVDYLGVTYVCLQAHTAQVGWEPPNVPALWGVV